MKSKLTKAAATALAMTMCVPGVAFAAESSGSFETSFDIYSPALTISVPLKADIKVNPIADSGDDTVKKFTVASNSIDVLNASVDAEADVAIPVNVTVKASIKSSGNDVVTEYNTFTADATSTKKRINLNLSEAGTAAVIGVKDGGTATFDSEKKLDLSQYAVTTDAKYNTPAKTTAITKYGSLLSVDIAGPTTTNKTAGAEFTTTAADVTAGVGSFAVTGEANTNADWKADDVAVDITYNVKASKALSITTPTITTPPTFTSGASAADVAITVPNVGEATVLALGVHNDEADYKDYIWEDPEAYTVDYTTTAGSAVITIPKDDAVLAFLAGDDYKGDTQDLVIALSDGRMVVSTLTVN